MYRNGTTSYGDALWHCKCDCGNECDIATRSLKSGLTQSCGCLRNEKTYEACGNNIANQRFGKLTALYPLLGTNSGNGIKWHCLCDCGNECDVALGNLTSGGTQSCGCLKMSHGELKINQLLTNNNINFIQEYRPKDSSIPFDARFDFYLPEQNYIIEFDGCQHYIIGTGLYNTLEKVQKTQEHDKIKNEWCKNNNIPLIRIPYTRYKELCLEDLLLETSQFII